MVSSQEGVTESLRAVEVYYIAFVRLREKLYTATAIRISKHARSSEVFIIETLRREYVKQRKYGHDKRVNRVP